LKSRHLVQEFHDHLFDLINSDAGKLFLSGSSVEDRDPRIGIRDRIAQHLPLRNRLLLETFYPTLFRELGPERREPARLLHVINTTLNIVRGSDPAMQERRAANFIITPQHSGNAQLGYRSSVEYGGPLGIGLGTAMAISGAAVSPNMGYYSSSSVTFLLALFNVRLGWWLGNPGTAGAQTFKFDAPTFGFKPLIDEAIGRTDDTHPYVYLSDGGHFENLGIYEMVRRRCKLIVVCDAGADAEFQYQDLAEAVRKIRIDLGVPISFDKISDFDKNVEYPPLPMDIDTQKTTLRDVLCAVATIHYDAVDSNQMKNDASSVNNADAGNRRDINGKLIYIKPAFPGVWAPADIRRYTLFHSPFPHQSTIDQFFTESQFEAYRSLGQFVIDKLLDGSSCNLTQVKSLGTTSWALTKGKDEIVPRETT
jgi:hypothetical protein